MKKIVSTAIFLFLFFNICSAQLSKFKILLGSTKEQVTAHFDSLFNLRSNPYYKIKKDFDDNGDLMLTAEFSLDDEKFYSCVLVTCTFKKVNNITEVCYHQMISGNTENADKNLNYIKTYFKSIGNATWERTYNETFKWVATFKKVESQESSLYIITHELAPKK